MNKDEFSFVQKDKRGHCGKMCFDKKTALTKRNFLLKKGLEKHLRVYQCDDCDGWWHLTKLK